MIVVRIAAFCLGILVAFSTANAESTCWWNHHGTWTCSQYTPRQDWRDHEYWRDEHRRHDWRDEHYRDWRDEHRGDYRR